MIKVMQHYADGGGVECSSKGRGIWNTLSNSDHYWNWQTMDYRIKQQKQKVTIEKWLMQNTIDEEYRIKSEKQKVTIEKWLCSDKQGSLVVIETTNIEEYTYITKKVKLIESYEVEI